MVGNVITANFRGARTTTTSPLWQYDYGQFLRFTGVSLPDTYEVHFSNNKEFGQAKTSIGTAEGVLIPDEYLVTGKPVFAWIFLHVGEDDGETVYMAQIPVRKRSVPSDEPPTPQEQSAITQAIAALNSAVVDVQEAVDAADSARASATSAASSATAAAASEAGVEADADRASTAATAAESAQTAAETAQTGAESARDEAAQASVAQIAQINATGAAVLESIPADYTELSDSVSDLKSDLEFTNNNLPWYQTYPVSIFSHGQVLYGTGEWSDTITRWGTKDLQYAEADIYLSVKEYNPELNYHVCYFTEDGTYTHWSTWKHKDSEEYKIPAGSYYKITIARRNNTSDTATIDYIYQLVKNTKLSQTAEDSSAMVASKFKWTNNGVRFDPILIGGYTGDGAIRVSTTLDYRKRYKTMVKPKFVYSGSYIYCDTARLYRMRVVKRETPESENGTIISDNISIPTQESPYIFSDDGYYSIHFMAYDGASEVVLDTLYSHLIFGLYSDTPNSMFVDFIGGGRTFQAPADATLFIGEHGKTLLIDGVYQNMQGNLINEIHNMGIDHLDYVMVSHYHNDHFAGLTILYENNDLSPNNTTFILPSESGVAYALEHLSSDMSVDWYNRFMAVLNNADCVIAHPTNNDVMNIGGMMVHFWNADHSIYEGVSTNYNDWSLCCYVTYGTQRICMTGDLGPIGERLNQGKMLKSNIYKAHHHGWDGTNDENDVMGMKRYMSEIMPDIIIALDGGAHDSLYLQDTSPLVPWCEANAVPLYRAHEWSPIKIEVTKNAFVLLTTARRYRREEA